MPFILGKTVSTTFLDRIASTPSQIGFKVKAGDRWREISYAEFAKDVREISFGLMGAGAERGDRVALLSQTRYEWSACDMAILGAGAVTVPIYPSSTPQDIGYLLEHSEAKILLLEDQTQVQKILSLRMDDPSILPNLKKIVVIDCKPSTPLPPGLSSLAALRESASVHEAKDPGRFERNLREAKPEDILSIVYTSGTTGIPKGALITHDNMVSVLEDALAVISTFSEPDSETILSYLPFSHILGKFESIAGYTFGWTQGYAESVEKVLENIQDVRPTLLFSVPRTFEKAYAAVRTELAHSSSAKKRIYDWAVKTGERYYGKLQAKQLPSVRDLAEYMLARKLVFHKVTSAFGGRLRFAICGGAPLSKELGEFFQIAGIKILEGYGLTETCGPVSVNTPMQVRYGTVGRPLAEVSVRLGQDGELEIRSRKVFAGYYKADEETRRVMPEGNKEGWFKTGDIGYIDDDGFIHITDRKKDLIITAGGKNIAPQRIESLAQGFPWLNQMVVLGDRRPYLVALLTLNREAVIQAASEKGILFSEYGELIRNPKILSITHSAIDKINSHLAKHETIKKFMILPNEFTVASGELTPSLKIKRKIIQSRYRREIDSLYETSIQTSAEGLT